MSLPENMHFDKRLLDRNLRQGLITQEQYDSHLGGLEDLKGKFVYIELAEEDEMDIKRPRAEKKVAPQS